MGARVAEVDLRAALETTGLTLEGRVAGARGAWLVRARPEHSGRCKADGLLTTYVSALGRLPAFRAVSLDGLPTVIATGIDVEPSTAPFFSTSDPTKALEYGGLPKLMIVLDENELVPSFQALPRTVTDEEQRAVLHLKIDQIG